MKTYVYFIQQGFGGIKIGVSENPEARCAHLQTATPKKLRVIAKFVFDSRAQAFGMERDLHAEYAHLRMKGEWFRRAILREMKIRGKRIIGGTCRNPVGGWLGSAPNETSLATDVNI